MSEYGSCAPDLEAVRVDGVTYTHGKMDYHPDFHPNNGKPFTQDELEYLCVYYGVDPLRTLGFALGRTEKSCHQKYRVLRNAGLIDHYKAQYKRKMEGRDE